jgi:O-antigen/teichoic acid export membrane protein
VGSASGPAFATNVLWSWASVIASTAMGVLVTPLLIWRLGDEAYGMWALVFSVTEYYMVLDLGARSTLVKYVAHYWALREDRELNRMLNSGIFYLVCGGACVLLATLVLAPLSPRLFVISPELRTTFVYMVLVTGLGWAFTIVFNGFSGCLEAIQRFDLSNRIQIVTNIGRVVGMLAVLQAGFGLRAVATVSVAARLTQGMLLARAFSRQCPQFHWSLAHLDREAFRKILSFGLPNVPSGLGALLLFQGPPILIGHALPSQFVGYYTLPGRLIQIAIDFVYRLGHVTNARASELVAHQRRDELIRLAVHANRFSLVLFMPFALFLCLYGDALFRVLSPEFAEMSAPLLPVFVLGTMLADAGQFNSGTILYSLARHRVLASALAVEAVLSSALVYFYAARGDLFMAALASTVLMVANRGCLTPYLVCRHLDYPVRRYIAAIAVRPLAAGAAAGAAMWVSRMTWLPGTTLAEIILAGVLGTVLVVALAGRYCLPEEHQADVLNLAKARAPFLERAARWWLGNTAGTPGVQSQP